MTNSLSSETKLVNLGVHAIVDATVDITSLASAGTEGWDPNSQLSDVANYDWVIPYDQENYDYNFQFDHSNDQWLVWEGGPRVQQKSTDPDSQTYSGSSDTTLATFNPGSQSRLYPLNFNPASPSDADLSVILRAEYEDGTTTDLVTESGGTEQSFENIVDGFATGDDDKEINKLLVVVNNSGTDVTEDIGATTTEFLAFDADAPNNEDVGTVDALVIGRR